MVPPRVEGSRANEGRTGHYGALDAAANGDGGSFGAGTKNVVKVSSINVAVCCSALI